jgi:hypothetical protein
MVKHRCWRFRISEAAAALGGRSSLDDLLDGALTDAIKRTRLDPSKKEHLILARLDPNDDEEWGGVLAPSPSDYGLQQAGAARLILVLIDMALPGSGIRGSPFLVEHLLKAAGGDDARANLAVRGRRLVTFFETHANWLASVAIECQHWLAGGWLDEPTAAALLEDLDRDTFALEAGVSQVAAAKSEPMQQSTAALETMIRDRLSDLRAMLTQAEPDVSLWIIED